MTQDSGPADKKQKQDIYQACLNLQNHVATLVRQELRNTNFEKGLTGVLLTSDDRKKLREISRQEVISDEDINLIIKKIVGSAASAQFINKHEHLADALEKYSAVTDLLNAKDDNSFRAKYLFHVSVINKNRDPETLTFISAVSQKLTGGHYNFKYVGENDGKTKETPAPARSQPRTPKAS